MKATAIYETVLYASDLKANVSFYSDVLGLELLSQNELMAVLKIGPQYLLLFDPTKSSVPDRLVPSHGTEGSGHVAFAMQVNELASWQAHLETHKIEIERVVEWESGKRGTSIYVRDPAGNSVELAPTILWSYLESHS